MQTKIGNSLATLMRLTPLYIALIESTDLIFYLCVCLRDIITVIYADEFLIIQNEDENKLKDEERESNVLFMAELSWVRLKLKWK